MEILEVRDVSKSYGKHKVLDHCGFKLEKGKITGLLGPNGEGKSTLIKIINGLVVPDTGSVLFDGMALSPSLRERIAYLPDRSGLDREMTVSQTLDWFADFYTGFDKGRARQLLDVFHLDPKQRIRTMSKGMQAKLQLALVLARKADLYILDEPLDGVDPASRDQILQTVLKNYSQEGAVLLCTHMVQDVELILDEVAFLSGGKLEGPIEADALREREKESVDAYFRRKYRCL